MTDFLESFSDNIESNAGAYGALGGLAALSNQRAQVKKLAELQNSLAESAKTEKERLVVEKQRLALARSLILEPYILFLDEPTASLDPDIGDFVRSYIQEYRSKNQVTILLASHNMNEVERLCDSIIMMKKGKIIDRGTCKEIIKKHGRNNLEETFLKLARSKDELQ